MSSNNKVTSGNTRPSVSKSAGLIWSELKKVTWTTSIVVLDVNSGSAKKPAILQSAASGKIA